MHQWSRQTGRVKPAVERATADKPRMLTRSPSRAEGRLLPKDGVKCSPVKTIRQGARLEPRQEAHMDMAIGSLSLRPSFDTLPARARALHRHRASSGFQGATITKSCASNCSRPPRSSPRRCSQCRSRSPSEPNRARTASTSSSSTRSSRPMRRPTCSSTRSSPTTKPRRKSRRRWRRSGT